MKAEVGVSVNMSLIPRLLSEGVVFFCFLFCFWLSPDCTTVAQLRDLTTVVAFTPFSAFSVWCSRDFYSLANKDARLETSYC